MSSLIAGIYSKITVMFKNYQGFAIYAYNLARQKRKKMETEITGMVLVAIFGNLVLIGAIAIAVVCVFHNI